MYIKRYMSEKDFTLIQRFDDGTERILPQDQHDYVDWVRAGNMPEIEAAGRFLSVIDGGIVVDPKREDILAAEEKERRDADTKAKLQEIDIASIRSIREYIVKQPDAPQILKDHETQAIAQRDKLK